MKNGPDRFIRITMATLIPQARLHVAAGGGHLVLIDSAEQIGPVITSFLRQDGAAS
jgi:pimeloyl-ACP methyl ester carboxylesterase